MICRYRFFKEIGNGTCGNVYKALNLHNNEIVAVKKMKRKFYSWEECLSLREVKLLQKLSHPSIVKLEEIVKENNELFLIFEHMDCNLYQIMRDRQRPFSESEIRNLMSQVLQGLVYMHRNGIFHRDLKPENLLVKNDIIKIADFGLAREVTTYSPYTDYVSTRWYRAPEVLLQSSVYSPAIDMWAVGAILAELFTLNPLFPGESETDQMYKICTVLGTPNASIWSDGVQLPHAINFNFFQSPPVNLSDVIPNASLEAIDLVQQLCCWDSRNRLTAEQSLRHPFFHVNLWLTDSSPKLELSLWDFDNESEDCFLGLSLAVESSIGKPGNVFLSLISLTIFLKEYGYQGHSEQLVFWPLTAPDNIKTDTPVMTSLTSSYMVNSQMSLQPFSVSEQSSYGISPLRPNLMDCHSFGPMMSLSSPIQQSLFFQ
ncbi:Cyclin-dependent kinase F-3 [Platanthera guangdongensis]|uniref:Cyclin-dependent kinase F-3 n=1 Tax=Platanthera guangdongensis TaxID=2320717 RepID=A0ABR2MD62_9ASPA